MEKLKLLFTILFVAFSLYGMTETSEAPGSQGDITGTVLDASDKRPVEYATIALYNQTDDKLISGGISDSEGFFRLKKTPNGTYYLTITFMGYKTLKIADLNLTNDTKTLDLGSILLEPNVKEIEGVDVVADQSAISYRIDKKVVNVSQQLTAKSGTAVDILENVPSVKVDIEGNVSLRGSTSFTVLIDGRPTVLDASDALSQIPASAIENIEIITNPSAKYEPDGTSGIINIITKKNKLNGMSGIINANVGRHGQYGGDATVDFRNDKWHLYFGADYNDREFPGETSSERWTQISEDSIRYLNADGDFKFGGVSGSLSGGFDYELSKSDVVGMSMRGGIRNRDRSSSLMYEDYINDENPFYYGTNQSSTWDGYFYSFTFDYKHTFASNKEHTLQFQAVIDGKDNDEKSVTESDTSGYVFEGKESMETGPSNGYRFKLDYVLPLAAGYKIEAGGQVQIQGNTDDNSVYMFDATSGDYVYQDSFSYTTNYTRNTYAAYGIFGGEWGNFGYQAGLRMEYTYRLLELEDSGESYKIDRPDYFPTLHFSYKLPADQEMMLSYTRRIERPRGHELEPFYTWEDANNIRKGNPELLPEYISSFDLGYQKKLGENFVSLEGYYRITNNKKEQVTRVYDADPKVNLKTTENVGKDYATGVELTFNYNPTKWYTTNLMGDVFDYRLKGELDGENFDQHDFSWNTRWNNTFKLSPNTRFQVDLEYHSAQIQAQGKEEGFFSTNAAIKQDFWKRKLSATFQVRDIFGTWGHENTTFGDNFEQHSMFNPDTPMVTLSLSYKLNNYKAKRNGGDSNSGGDMDEGGSGF